jgi:hypothetical protein
MEEGVSGLRVLRFIEARSRMVLSDGFMLLFELDVDSSFGRWSHGCDDCSSWEDR